MAPHRSTRLYFFIALGLVITAFLLYVPRTDIPARSKQYVQDILAGGSADTTADDSADEILDNISEEIADNIPAKITATTSSKTSDSTATSSVDLPESTHEEEPDESTVPSFNFDKSFFQGDLDWFDIPVLDIEKLKDLPPMHYHGPGHPTFATFYASRNASMHDPYFLAAQQILYRLLWDPRSRTTQYPFTVFVAPFVPQEQRDFFSAAGAVVRELPLRLFSPEHPGVPGRLVDMMSKLEMWTQTDFSLITYLDSDAFPVANIDHIFTLAEPQQCKKDLLPSEDASVADEICPYTFTGYKDLGDVVNAGVMIFSPNNAMHARLAREMLDKSNFDNGFMEQALLGYAYSPDGPFPPTYIPHSYNGGPDLWLDGGEAYIVHAKLWSMIGDVDTTWYKHTFNYTWLDMQDLYGSAEFQHLRESGSIPSDLWYCCRDLKPEFRHVAPPETT